MMQSIFRKNIRRAFFYAEKMKRVFVVFLFVFVAILSLELLGEEKLDSVPAVSSVLTQEETNPLNEVTKIAQSISQTNSPAAKPVLSPEEAAQANEEAVKDYINKKNRYYFETVLLVVVFFLGVVGIALALYVRYKKERRAFNLSMENGELIREERFLFLDVLKGIAIIAVICDHCICWSKLCPLSFLPGKYTYFSVSLFVLCAGYTSAMSLEKARKKDVSTQSWIIKKITHILYYYLVATAFYLLIRPSHIILFSSFVDASIQFNAAAPFYFVCFFIQLLCIAPLSFGLLSISDTKKNVVVKVLFFLIVVLLSLFCMSFSRIGSIYGAGRYLFGGTFLMVYVLGQIIYVYRNYLLTKKGAAIALGGAFLIYQVLLTSYFSKLYYVRIVNPPGVLYISYAVTIFFAVAFLFSFNSFSMIRKVFSFPVSFLGKYSFEIFLYHLAVIQLANNYFRYNNDSWGGGIFCRYRCKQNKFFC